jgi:hypothetical protein
MAVTDVDLWVDPACPWAWITSRWLLEVEQLRAVTTRFHVMSLAILNQDKAGISEEYRERVKGLRGPVRVLTAADSRYGSQAVRDLYGAMGERVHHARAGTGRDMVLGALHATGLSPRLADAFDSTEYDGLLQASHDAGMALVGQEVGTPVLHVHTDAPTPVAFFGPVVTPIPRGDAAAKLWDGVLAVASTDGFFELKRTRDRRPNFD